MPTSGTRPKAKKITSAKNWKKQQVEMDLDLPSGNTCRIRRPGLTKLVTDGILPDAITAIAMQSVERGQGKGKLKPNAELSGDDLKKMIAEPGSLAALMDAMDRVTAHCVIEPPVLYHRVEVDGKWVEISQDDRDDEFVYTDEVEDDDKAYIFEVVCGGAADLATFREKSSQAVAGV